MSSKLAQLEMKKSILVLLHLATETAIYIYALCELKIFENLKNSSKSRSIKPCTIFVAKSQINNESAVLKTLVI